MWANLIKIRRTTLIGVLTLLGVIGIMTLSVIARGEPKKERRILYWQAPMDPNYIRFEPGKSPMGMDLIPVYEDEVGEVEAGTVLIDPVTVQNIGVKTEKAESRRLHKVIRTVGRVDYDETKMTDVNTKIAGWVEKLFVDYTGQKVKKGDRLLEIYSPDLVSTQEEYLTALRYRETLSKSPFADIVAGADALVESSRRRLIYWDITEEQIEELEETEEIKKTMTLYSPQNGIVVHKSVFDGMHIKSGEHLYRIGDISTIWVYADIYEYELSWIEEGQKAHMTLAYYPGETFEGKITFVYPFLESKTRTVKARIEFPNYDWKLKPHMYVNVNIMPEVAKETVVVPDNAVIHSGERQIVIVDKGGGKFQPREITLGVEAGGYYQVLDGVYEGERIVTSANFLIDSESNLKAAISTMISAKTEAAAEEGEMEHEEMKMEEDKSDTTELKDNQNGTKHEEMKHEGMKMKENEADTTKSKHNHKDMKR